MVSSLGRKTLASIARAGPETKVLIACYTNTNMYTCTKDIVIELCVHNVINGVLCTCSIPATKHSNVIIMWLITAHVHSH